MKLRKTLFVLSMLAVSSAFFYACQKEESASSAGKTRMQVYLTDDPGNYDEVVIDIQDIKINYSSDSVEGWQSLSNVKTGTYDILKLVAGKDTLLGDAELNPGKIEQIRLILGPNNYVKVDGQQIPLQTPSAQQSGLKLNIHQEVNGGTIYKLLLDFDAARSIVKTGNSKYILKPVIRSSLQAVGGSIRGFVLPDSLKTAVFAIQGADTVTSSYTSNGNYTLKGLNAGTYTLSFAPTDTTYKTQTKTGITVTTSTVTTVDTVKLVK
jgi:Domain of unknown function (DUF4382)